MNKPIIVRDRQNERVIDLYPQGDPASVQAYTQQLQQIAHPQVIQLERDPSHSRTEEKTNAMDRTRAILTLAAGVTLINLPISLGLAWAAGWGVPGWAFFFGIAQLITFSVIYRTQLQHSPAGVERQRQEQDHELRMQQQTDATVLRHKVVDHMLNYIANRDKPNSQPMLFVRDNNQVTPNDH